MRRFPIAPPEQNLAFWRAAEANDARAVKRLMEGGLRPDAWVEDPEADEGGTGLLHGAAGLAAVDVVRLLLRAGMSVDERRGLKEDAPAPLHVAAQNAGMWRGSAPFAARKR